MNYVCRVGHSPIVLQAGRAGLTRLWDLRIRASYGENMPDGR